MQGERTYAANILASLPGILLLLALAAPAWGQVTISSIQSSLVGAGSPNNVQGITSGAQLPGNGFTMWINGSFPNAAVGTTVQWFNPSTGATFSASTTPNGALNQLQVFIPENLYLTPVASTQTVQITVTQGASQATGQFFVNVPLAMAASPLPLATSNVPYSAPIANGGTAPYSLQSIVGALPNGLSITGNLLGGTPNAAGVFSFTPQVADQWVSAQGGLQIQVIGPATHFTVSAPASATAGSAFNFTVTALDQFNNAATGYGGTVHFTGSDGQAVLPANSTLTNGTGSFSATLKTAGNQTLGATDTANASITGTSNTVAVSAGTATHFTVSAPASATAGSSFNFTVTALDQFNNTATGYGGTVHFTGSDGQAVLPANSTLTSGTGSFSALLRTLGSQTITANDTANGSITGTSNTVTVNVLTGAIHLLGPGACPAASNWSNANCWDLNRAPASGDDVMIDNGAQAQTNYDLAAGVQLHSLAISSASGAVVIGGGNIGLQSGGTVTDSLNNGTDTLSGITLNGPATFTVSAAGETLRIGGAITGAFGLTKTGPGTLLLAGANTYSGTTTVNGGTVNVSGSLANSAVTVGSGGTLTGTGSVKSIAAQAGGAVAGNLSVTGGVTFAAGSSFNVTLTSNNSFSQLTAGGTTDLSAGPTLNITVAPGFTPAAGTAFTIVPGAVTGNFNGLGNASIVKSAGVTFRINYASVTLVVIPIEPIPTLSGWGLGLLAALLVALSAFGPWGRSRFEAS